MPTVESDITRADREEYVSFLRLLTERVEHNNAPRHYLFQYQLPDNRSYGSFWRGFKSLSLLPPDHTWEFIPPSDEEGFFDDWHAVGHDLFTAILQYARTDYPHGRSTESDSEPRPDWTLSAR